MFGFNTDEKLIHKALRGTESAWLALVKRHEQRVYNHLLRIVGQRADAMDLLQDTFLAVYRNLPNYRGDGVFLGWVMRIASNRALDFLRSKARKPEQALEGDEQNWDVQRSEDPSDNLHLSQRKKAVLRMLQQLSPEVRLVVELKFFQQRSFQEIGQHMGIPTTTAKTRFYAALKNLRQFVEVDDVI